MWHCTNTTLLEEIPHLVQTVQVTVQNWPRDGPSHFASRIFMTLLTSLKIYTDQQYLLIVGYRGGSPTDPALCGSRPLIPPYNCKTRGLAVFICVISLFWVFPFTAFSFSTLILLVLTCKNRLPYNLYCVGGDVKHCSLTHLLIVGHGRGTVEYILGNCDMCPVCIANAAVIDSDCWSVFNAAELCRRNIPADCRWWTRMWCLRLDSTCWSLSQSTWSVWWTRPAYCATLPAHTQSLKSVGHFY